MTGNESTEEDAYEETANKKAADNIADNRANENLFPYEQLREVQKDMMQEVTDALEKKGNLIVHAPTGLGKTAAAIAPALKYALSHKKKVFFLTSRHTQHIIAIETLKEIKRRHDTDFIAVDIIGKKWMCSVPGIDALQSSEFHDYCEKQRDGGLCEYYNNTKKGSKMTTEANLALENLRTESPCHIEQFTDACSDKMMCAYELAASLAKEAAVIVTDYYYIYHQRIRDAFFKRAGIQLEDCVVIVDEGHNLPDRIRNLMTAQLTNYMMKRAIAEAAKLGEEELTSKLSKIQDIINELSQGMRDGDEKLIDKEEVIKKVEKIDNYDDLVAALDLASQSVRIKEKRSFMGGVAAFLDSWKGTDEGYARILSQKQTKRESVVVLAYRCLEPGIVSKDVISNCHSTILMSGTLTPTAMYRDILGFPEKTTERRYPSPFPQKNRLAMIIPETTTKFSQRNPAQYKRIAQICAEITNRVPGSTAVFFPSYFVRDQVYNFYNSLSVKTAFLEDTEMSKEEKGEFLERFKKYKDSGAVLLGVMSGSYGEGIDLPGNILKCVIVVGLPLQQPTLETNLLIKYYDAKFGKGWDYGYVAPAFSKCLQSAGRCIRSEKDRGVVAFLDERYTWQNYFKHFPADWDIKTTKLYLDRITEFFKPV